MLCLQHHKRLRFLPVACVVTAVVMIVVGTDAVDMINVRGAVDSGENHYAERKC